LSKLKPRGMDCGQGGHKGHAFGASIKRKKREERTKGCTQEKMKKTERRGGKRGFKRVRGRERAATGENHIPFSTRGPALRGKTRGWSKGYSESSATNKPGPR